MENYQVNLSRSEWKYLDIILLHKKLRKNLQQLSFFSNKRDKFVTPITSQIKGINLYHLNIYIIFKNKTRKIFKKGIISFKWNIHSS